MVDVIIQDSYFYHQETSGTKAKNVMVDILRRLRDSLPATSDIKRLATEIDLLNSYSTDTIYRLRYDSMVYEYISPSVQRLLGFTPEEMKKINLRSLILETKMVTNGMKKVINFHELERNRIKGDVNRWQADYLIRTKDGRKIWVADVSYPWFDETGRILGSIGTLRDISERVEAEAQVKEELARLALTDSLTGLANRREFFRRLDLELKRLHRTKTSLSMLIIDIDHFKKINDAFGHDVGDMVLVDMAKVINRCLRETDLAARLGGEEYGIILPDTPANGAYWVAERICNKISRHMFYADKQRQRAVKCTVSIGISSVDLDATLDGMQLYKLADNRLYIAKNTGRNQVSLDEVLQLH